MLIVLQTIPLTRHHQARSWEPPRSWECCAKHLLLHLCKEQTTSSLSQPLFRFDWSVQLVTWYEPSGEPWLMWPVFTFLFHFHKGNAEEFDIVCCISFLRHKFIWHHLQDCHKFWMLYCRWNKICQMGYANCMNCWVVHGWFSTLCAQNWHVDFKRRQCLLVSDIFRRPVAFVGGREVAPGLGGGIMCHLQTFLFYATHLTCSAAASC